LSVFRRPDVAIVQDLQRLALQKDNLESFWAEFSTLSGEVSYLDEWLKPFEKSQIGALAILSKLTATALINAPTSKKGYYHDGIIHKLILSQMKWNEKESLRQLNILACTIYDFWLCGRSIIENERVLYPTADQNQQVYIQESFYHFLCSLQQGQGGSSDKIKSKITWYLEDNNIRLDRMDKALFQENLFILLESDEEICDKMEYLFGEEADDILRMFLGN
jgi:hypothetical protein